MRVARTHRIVWQSSSQARRHFMDAGAVVGHSGSHTRRFRPVTRGTSSDLSTRTTLSGSELVRQPASMHRPGRWTAKRTGHVSRLPHTVRTALRSLSQ